MELGSVHSPTSLPVAATQQHLQHSMPRRPIARMVTTMPAYSESYQTPLPIHYPSEMPASVAAAALPAVNSAPLSATQMHNNKNINNVKEEGHTCMFCGNYFARSNNLTQHIMSRHTREAETRRLKDAAPDPLEAVKEAILLTLRVNLCVQRQQALTGQISGGEAGEESIDLVEALHGAAGVSEGGGVSGGGTTSNTISSYPTPQKVVHPRRGRPPKTARTPQHPLHPLHPLQPLAAHPPITSGLAPQHALTPVPFAPPLSSHVTQHTQQYPPIVSGMQTGGYQGAVHGSNSTGYSQKSLKRPRTDSAQ
eukprot:TRINITY_DN3338_c0_g1_i3.p1 TRINITY_DN3338_c0_g1~~TRINITY_DN3338_c0_g1_i3.p1  ORF type:complete len:309 (-),score=60.29 TRINITY_DN3338_c0_g1_i3:129-1055(-)